MSSVLLYIFILIIPVSLLLLVGFTVLQVYLSLRKSVWPGLVLPAINLLTVLVPLVLLLLPLNGSQLPGDGLIAGSKSLTLIGMVCIFALISLLVNLLAYLICRRRLQRNSQRELKKMSIQDLS